MSQQIQFCAIFYLTDCKGVPYAPLWKPKKTYAIDVKIAGRLEVFNSSTKMVFQVNWSIFEEVRPVWSLRKSYLCAAAKQN